MDGNIYQNSPNTDYPPYAPDLSNDRSNEIMPPVAPERNVYPAYDSERQALNRLMDSVHKGRIEDVRIGQDTAKICLEDAQVVGGAIEIRARIVPEPRDYIIPARTHEQPVYPYPYPNQIQPQYPYQYQSQLPLQYYQYPSQYLNQIPLQYSYPYRYPNQFPARYFSQYPITHAAGSIASAISQLVFTANLLKR